jgi:hypothetical protein
MFTPALAVCRPFDQVSIGQGHVMLRAKLIVLRPPPVRRQDDELAED